MEDITKTGPVGLKGLRGIDAEQDDNTKMLSRIASLSDSERSRLYSPKESNDVELGFIENNVGESIYDKNFSSLDQFTQDPNEYRAQSQSAIAKLGAGVAKGISLAATTFIDGTLGAVLGAFEMPDKGIAALWENEVSTATQQLNDYLEKALPNYKTNDEQNASLFEKMGTMNFWADSLLKNLGFAVGAAYSGGAWLKALKAVGAVKGVLAAKTIGSITSAINEGRIEANNTADEWEANELSKLDSAMQRKIEDIANSDASEEDKQYALQQLRFDRERMLQDIKDRKDKVGMTDLIGNTILLTLTNLSTFGRLYARGFSNARRTIQKDVVKDVLAGKRKLNRETLNNITKEVSTPEWQKKIVKGDKAYSFSKESMKGAVGRGIKTGIVEGNEEMSQAFLSETSKYLQEYDSPDSYYKALNDPKAQKETVDLLDSVTRGFIDTYGNGDRYEEFAVGALTGLLGIPTFGRNSNSDANTYLGKNKPIGLSGGLFGEISNARNINKRREELTNGLNEHYGKLVEGLEKKTRHFVRSQAFSNAMSGWAEEGDAFEYKNAEDNDLFSAIDAFSKAGKLDDLKDMVNQDYENITDEELEDIATNTTPVDSSFGGWKGTDGELLSKSEEGRKKMKEELIKKRDKTLDLINSYENSISTVRSITNGVLPDDQVEELAWLHWKVGRYKDRYNEIRDEMHEHFNTFLVGLKDYKEHVDKTLEHNEEGTEDYAINKTLQSEVEGIIKIIETINNYDNVFMVNEFFKKNPEAKDILLDKDRYETYAEASKMDYNSFVESLNKLIDVSRLANAAYTFNEKLKSYIEDSSKLEENRKNIDKKEEKKVQANEKIDEKTKIRKASVTELTAAVDDGSIDEDALSSYLDEMDEDDDFTEEEVNKVKSVKEIQDEYKQTVNAVNSIDDKTVTTESKNDYLKLLEKNKRTAEKGTDVTDMSSQVFNDPNSLIDEGDPMEELAQDDPEGLKELLQDRLDKAKQVGELAEKIKNATKEELDELPTIDRKKNSIRSIGQKKEETGHDSTSTITPVNGPKIELPKKLSNEEIVNEAIERDRYSKLSFDKDALKTSLLSLYKDIEILHKAGVTDRDLAAKVRENENYDIVKNMIGENNLKVELNYFVNLLNYYDSLDQSQAQKDSDENYLPLDVPTKTITENGLNILVNAEAHRNFNLSFNSNSESYTYWFPLSSYYPIHKRRGEDKAFYELVKNDPRYTEAQKKRIIAVNEYLNSHGAFKLRDSGEIKKGDTIHFMIDKKLNEQTGANEVTVLLTLDDGRIVGDLVPKSERTNSKQIGLPEFIDRITKEYEDAGSPDKFVSKETTTVEKIMIGKVPYSAKEDMHTLNEIFTASNAQGTSAIQDFKLAVAVTDGSNATMLATPGRVKRQGLTSFEKSIVPPISAVLGMPYLLLPTSSKNKAFVTVPFVMPVYSEDTKNSKLGEAIESTLADLASITTNKEAMLIADEMQNLLCLPTTTDDNGKKTKRIFIELNNGQIKMHVIPMLGEPQIVTCDQKDPNLVDVLKKRLYGIPFSISLKYINGSYKGQNYNQMIGELAKTNLAVGSTHTVNDWFTMDYMTEDGTKKKAKSPRSTGVNPNAVKTKLTSVTFDNVVYNYNPKTKELTRDDGNPITNLTELGIQEIKAQAFGITNAINLNVPYATPWGMFDYNKHQFIKEKKVIRSFNIKNEENKPKSSGITRTITPLTYYNDLWNDLDNLEIAEIIIRPDGSIDIDTGFSFTNYTGINNEKTSIKVANILFPEVFNEDGSIKDNIPSEIEVSATSKSGKTAKGKYVISKDSDGYIRIEYEGVNIAKRFLTKDELSKNGITQEDILGSPDTWNTFTVDLDKINELNKNSRYTVETKKDQNGDIDVYTFSRYREKDGKKVSNAGIFINPETISNESAVKIENYSNIQLLELRIKGNQIDGTILAKREDGASIKFEVKFHVNPLKGINKIQEEKEDNTSNTSKANQLNTQEQKDNEVTNIGKKILDRILGIEKPTNINFSIFAVTKNHLDSINKIIKDKKDKIDIDSYKEIHRLLINIYDSLDGLIRTETGQSDNEETLSTVLKLAKGIINSLGYNNVKSIEDEVSKALGRKETVYNNNKYIFTTKNGIDWMASVMLGMESSNIPSSENNEEDYQKLAEEKNLLNTDTRKELWKVLTPEQQKIVANKKGPKVKQWMEKLEGAFDPQTKTFDTTMLGGSVDALLSRKGLYRKASDSLPKWNRRRETKWMQKVLPNLSTEGRIKVIDGLIKISEEDGGGNAWGMFKDGIITLSTNAAKGTLYHEAFHSVAHTLLSNEEFVSMLEAAKEKYGNMTPVELEENLAEDFRRYVQLEETPIIGKLVKLFRTLKHIIKHLFGKELYLDSLYYRINRGKLGNENPNDFNTKNNDTNHYRKEEIKNYNETKEKVKTELQTFLSNFGISINEIKDYDSNVPLFDALNKTINAKNAEEITDGVGYAVAFMMQYDPQIREMISVLKTGSKTALVKYNFHKPFRLEISDYLYKYKTDKTTYLKYLGEEIAIRLKELYNLEEPKYKDRSFWKIITEFFNKLNPFHLYKVRAINNMMTPIVNAIVNNDKSLIIKDYIKPGTTEEAQLLDVGKALIENPYEESIISNLNKKGIALAGSASMALSGTMYRPSENPLHDLDFEATDFNKESIDKILSELYPNFKHTNRIQDKFSKNKVTETYLIMDRPFTTKRELNGFGIETIFDAKTGEKLGTRAGSNLILKEGVKGKMLDFFTGRDENSFNDVTIDVNGKEYLIGNYKNALDFKIKVARDKDIWDYNRFILNKENLWSTDRYANKDIASATKEIDQYHKDKLMYGNLNQEQKDYMNVIGISIAEYNSMSQEEKNIMFKCM